MSLPTFQDVQRAVALLKGIANITPIHTSRQLNEISRATVFLKCENFQRVGAFKFRGAYKTPWPTSNQTSQSWPCLPGIMRKALRSPVSY